MAGMRRWRLAWAGAGDEARPRWSLCAVVLLILAGVLATCGLAACGAAQPSLSALPGGSYTSAQYHFSITYPAGWQASVAPEPSPAPGTSLTIPLTLVITRTSATQGNVDLVSNVTIAVINASDPTIAPSVAALKTDPAETHVTVGGLPGYADPPATQQVANGSSITDTHSAYYVVANGYEYQITTDALSSDNAAPAIAQMLASFKVTK